MKHMICIGMLTLATGASALAWAQDLEPGVQTSGAAAPAAAGATPAGAAQPASPPPASARPDAAVRSPAAAPKAVAARAKGDKSGDRVDLEATQISGNRELPKVMYVVPWRKAELGEFAGRPPNSLLDEALTPVDRDVFKRQNRYYAALQEPTASAPKSQPDAAGAAAPAARPEDEK